MKILITGHTGFIGNELSKYLSKKNFSIIGISRTSSKENYFIYQSNLNLTNVSKQDLNNISQIKLFEDIDLIINASSILANTKNINSMDLLFNNIKMTENLVKISNLIKPKQIINLSSMAVYPDIDGDNDENSMVYMGKNREGLYGLSKFCSENILDFYLSDSIKIIHLRLSQVYGVKMRLDRIYAEMKKELSEKNYITVWGNGERISNFIEVNKLCHYIYQIILNGKLQGVFNLGDRNISYEELAKLIIEKHGNAKSKINILSKGKKYSFRLNLKKWQSLNFDNIEN